MHTKNANSSRENRLRLLIITALTLLLSFGMAFGQSGSIYISDIDGDTSAAGPVAVGDSLLVGVPIIWTMNVDNSTGEIITGPTNGFRVFSPDGATWAPLVLDGGAGIDEFGTVYTTGFGPENSNFFRYAAPTNSGSGTTGDTVGIGGISFSPTPIGFPIGMNAPAIVVTIPSPGIDPASNGKTICIDESGYQFNSDWIWATLTGGYIPIWGPLPGGYGGPQCFTVVDPNASTVSNLIVDQQTLSFTATEGGSNPAPQTVNVSSDGDPLDFTLTKDSAWLSTTITNSTTPMDFDVNIDISGLAPGVYVDTIDVTSGAADNSPQYIEVTLTVNAAPKNLALNPDTLSFTAQEGGSNPADKEFEISEVSGFNIVYTAVETSGWISLNKAGGNTDDTVTVSINISGLIAGSYKDSIEIASSDADNSPLYEYILLEVTPAPKFLAVNPDTLYFSGIQDGPNPDPDTFSVSETGGATIGYSLSESSSWITLDKSSGNTPDDVEVSVNITGLTEGSYLDSVQVSSGEADNSPVWEFVQLTVGPPAQTYNLGVTTDTVEFSAVEGGSDPASENFGVFETGGGSIVFTVTESTDWFDLSPAGGTTPDVISVFAMIGSLTPGTYYGDISVAADSADNSPLTVTVKFTISALPRFILASPNAIGPSMTAGGPPFSPYTIHVIDSANIGLAYSVTESVGWLNVDPNSGTTEDSFLVVADTAFANALSPGVYADSIAITSGEADNSPIYVFATLEVLEAPNNPPVIDTIGDQTMNEGDHLDFSFGANDLDDDSLHFFTGELPAFGSFFSDSSNTGYFAFDPGFNNAGVYNITVYVSDGKDTASESFQLTVIDVQPGTEGDTLHVATVPAVPGQQVIVPIDMANSCDVYSISVPFYWDGAGYIILDSGVFNDSLVGGISNKYISFDNDADTGQIWVEATGSEDPIPPGHNWLIQLYYSVSPETPHGAYNVTPHFTETMFGRDCGSGLENIIPIIPGGGGSIVVDTTNVYVCGYVIDEDSLGIGGATVELWPSFPCDGPLLTTTSNGDGAYAFTGFQLGSFDLYAYKSGEDTTTWNDSYHPTSVHVNFGENAITLLLPAVQHITPSDMWVDYFCDLNTLFGCDLPVGSIVEASNPNGLICGRQFVRNPGVYKFMPVYRDSAGSLEIEGAVTGDNIRFYVNGVEALADGNTIYPAAYDTMRVCLAGGERLTKECQLFEGWNLVSWNLNTDTDDIATVLNSLNGCIDVVLGFEQGGLTYVPGMDIFNTLTAVDHLSGYWIKLKENCNVVLAIEGVSVDQDFPIGLNGGWNLVSYLPNDIIPVENALYSIAGNFQIAYTYDATPLVFVPGMDTVFNTLDEMESCFGYWIKVNNPGVLTYPSIPGASTNPTIPFVAKDLKDKLVEPTRNWVNLYSYNLTVDGITVNAGSQITAHNNSGNIIGHFEMTESGTFGFMPVYADADGVKEVGIKKGETFYLSVDGNTTNESFTWTDQGALIEVAALTTSGNGNVLPEAYSLSQNYPNPFNPTTTISFSLPTAGNARIEIFNLLGQKVATPFDGFAQAGEHKVVWDGRNENGESAASGIYLYRMVVDNDKVVETRKMSLIK